MQFLLEDPIAGPLSVILLPTLVKTVRRDGVCLAAFRGTRTVLAIRRFQIDHGNALPESLAPLAPTYLDAEIERGRKWIEKKRRDSDGVDTGKGISS